MEFIEKHKALIITVLISGTVLLALFSISLEKHVAVLSESYYEIPPEPTPEEKKIIEEMAMREANMAETNQAYNSSQDFKDMMKNFKTVKGENADQSDKKSDQDPEEASEEEATDQQEVKSEDYSLQENELTSYSKINEVIAMRSANKKRAASGNQNSDQKGKGKSINTNSSVSYSLSNRTDEFLPPPVYLCEESGKIVINITVNAAGDVTDAYVNNSSTSRNACLIESALQYAREARFNADPAVKSQIGSITYYFKGKS